MTDETTFSDNLHNAATNIGKIMADMKPFEDIRNHWPNAGKFELAQWLERIVDDRRNAVQAHAEHLRLTFDSMNTTLTQIANDFKSTDGDNAGKIKNLLGDLEDTVGSEWSEWDENTEKDWKNYTSDGNKDNARDGDGYNDNLNTPVGEDDSGNSDSGNGNGGDGKGGDNKGGNNKGGNGGGGGGGGAQTK